MKISGENGECTFASFSILVWFWFLQIRKDAFKLEQPLWTL